MIPTPDPVTGPPIPPPRTKTEACTACSRRHMKRITKRTTDLENRGNVFWYPPALTCGGDAVKSYKSIKAGSSSRKDACETEWHEATHS